MGAGPARPSIILVPQPTKLAIVTVNVAQVGDDAMVDSGNMVSVIRKDVVVKILSEENKFGIHVVVFDRMKVPVIGEIALTVRFEGRTEDLQRVKVDENSLCDLILWSRKEMVIYAENGRLLAHVRPRALDVLVSIWSCRRCVRREYCSAYEPTLETILEEAQ